MAEPKILGLVEPQPPSGIMYMLGGESWRPAVERTPIRLHVEEWGNLGPLELNSEIQANEAGFRVRQTDIPAPPGALGIAEIDGKYYWTDTDMFGQTADERYKD